MYTEFFDQHDALDKLEAFASFYGPDFYGLPRNQDKINLTKNSWTVPDEYKFGEDVVIPIRAGQSVQWQLEQD